ncbi:MAG: N-acetylmuramoyl-L-alanine amidase family protein [Hydrogeniiclostridium sp.]
MATICIDAGHYGKVNRSPVVPEYYESDMAWKLHLLLKSELEKRGISVITTRPTQAQDLELTARGRKASGCDLFLSLHSNAVGTESVDRPVGIYLMPDDTTTADEKSKEIAALLAKTVRNVMGTTQAEQIMDKVGNDRNGDGKPDDYYGVLYGAHSVNVPGVILEHGFHTNRRCAEWLLQESNLQKLAVAEAEALANYFGTGKTESTPSDNIYRVRKSWADGTSQKGAFASLENAVELAKSTGLKVYDGNGKQVYPAQEASTPAPSAASAVYYRVRTQAHGWLPEVKGLADYAGYQDSPITDIAVRVTAGTVKYRVHVLGGGWLPYVTGCDINDSAKGYAGSGKAIDAVEAYYSTPKGRTVRRAKYRAAPTGGNYYPWQYDNETTGGQDGYAGAFGRRIGRLQITLE